MAQKTKTVDMLKARRNRLVSNQKENEGVLRKLDRQIRNLEKKEQ